jgi:hypothetical protein
MNLAQQYSHHRAVEELQEKSILSEILSLPESAEVAVCPKATPQIKAYYQRRIRELGWAMRPKVHDDHGLTINAMKSRVALTVQTGNVTRAFYDLMKFQVMYLNNRIDVAALILPTQAAAETLGDNISDYARVSDEIRLFRHVITVPCLLVAFQ